MTICIAAIAREKEKEYIVFATDHMVSTQMGQFEHTISKYKQITENAVAMLAGNPLIFESLIKIEGEKKSFDTVKEEIHRNFKKRRKEFIKNDVLDKFGINEQFLLDALQKPIPNPYIHTIFEQIAKFELQTSIMLVGFDNSVAKICEIDENGHDDLRDMNFHAIGSGAAQAANTMLFQKHAKEDNLQSTIYAVYKAKKNAEASQGVGRETELLVFCPNRVIKLDTTQLNMLETIYLEELKYGRSHPHLKGLKIEVA